MIPQVFVDYAEARGADCVLAFGSHGRGDATKHSDFDICIVNAHSNDRDYLLTHMRELVPTGSLVYSNSTNKIVCLLNDERATKIDCFIVQSFDSVAKYIIGSELTQEHIQKFALLYCANSVEGDECLKWLKNNIPSSVRHYENIDLNTALHYNTVKFIESFEASCNKLGETDRFQYLFQLQLAYTALIKLEYMNRGGRRFMYLPKHVLNNFDVQTRKTFENILEPCGDLHIGKQKLFSYLRQFEVTASGLECKWGSLLQGCPVSSIVEVLRKAVHRSEGSIVAYYGRYEGIRVITRIYLDSSVDTSIELELSTNEPIWIDLVECSGLTIDSDFLSSVNIRKATGALGLIFRTLLTSSLSVAFHSSNPRKVALVKIVLQILEHGHTNLSMIESTFHSLMNSTASTTSNDFQQVLEEIGDVTNFLARCGLSVSEIYALQDRISMDRQVSSQRIIPKPSFKFERGCPAIACRPFLDCEVLLLKRHILHGVPKDQANPLLIVLTGVPASGKTTSCKLFLKQFNIALSDCRLIDMDIVRLFHAQFQTLRHRCDEGDGSLLSYDDLVGWFVNAQGSTVENMIFKQKDSVVNTLLDSKSHIVLSCVLNNGTIDFLRHCHIRGYRLALIGVDIPKATAIRQSECRARTTGRFTPISLIDPAKVQRNFKEIADFVAKEDGDICLFSNDLSMDDPTPELVYDYRSKTMYNETLARQYVSSTLVEEKSSEKLYDTLGYVLLSSVIPSDVTESLGIEFETKINDFADEACLSRDEYLSVSNKWSHCNAEVMRIMECLASILRRKVAYVLHSNVAWPVGAVLFRKSSFTSETHSHQDLSYARHPGSQMFRATTWVPLLLRNADTLAFAPGSHRGPIFPVQDFLDTKSESVMLPDCCDALTNVSLGDCILFDSRVVHKSTRMPTIYSSADPINQSDGLRLAIGIQWLTPGGLDGLQPGSYFRWPAEDVPSQVNLEQKRKSRVFGIDTAGYFLKKALAHLSESISKSSIDFEKHSTFKLAEVFADSENIDANEVLKRYDLDPDAVHQSLKRYVLFRRAAMANFGELQGVKIFKPLYDTLIAPFLLRHSEIFE